MTCEPFNDDEPLAYFITWTTYGTWLPGDDRGWNRIGGADILDPNPLFQEMARNSMKETAFVLGQDDRDEIENTIIRHCQIRQWKLHAVNVRSNHVHVVVTAPNYSPETVRDQFKGWGTRRLKSKYVDRERFWTQRGSCRWLNQESELESTVMYVTDAQDRKALDYEQE